VRELDSALRVHREDDAMVVLQKMDESDESPLHDIRLRAELAV